MKLVKVLSTTILFLLPGALVPLCAQEHREQEKQPEQKQQAKPAQPQQRAEHQQTAKPAQPQQRAEHQQPAKPAQPQQRAEHQQPAKPAQAQQRVEHQQQTPTAQPQQRANRGQSAGRQGQIPDDRFRASFGRAHTFRVNRADFQGRSRRFQYGGYWFNVLNPWPVGWLYTDNVYVDYMNGGYFLCDPVHPGVYLSISIG
jgi:hypothetical protein